jgi:hypothetical protein
MALLERSIVKFTLVLNFFFRKMLAFDCFRHNRPFSVINVCCSSKYCFSARCALAATACRDIVVFLTKTKFLIIFCSGNFLLIEVLIKISMYIYCFSLYDGWSDCPYWISLIVWYKLSFCVRMCVIFVSFHCQYSFLWSGTYVTRYCGDFWPIVQPQMRDEGDCGAIGGMKIGRGINWIRYWLFRT